MYIAYDVEFLGERKYPWAVMQYGNPQKKNGHPIALFMMEKDAKEFCKVVKNY